MTMKQFIRLHRAEIDSEIKAAGGTATAKERELFVDNTKHLYIKAKAAGVYEEEVSE